MATLAAIAFRDVERDGAERPSDLLAEIAIQVPDARDRWAKNLDGVD